MLFMVFSREETTRMISILPNMGMTEDNQREWVVQTADVIKGQEDRDPNVKFTKQTNKEGAEHYFCQEVTKTKEDGFIYIKCLQGLGPAAQGQGDITLDLDPEMFSN